MTLLRFLVMIFSLSLILGLAFGCMPMTALAVEVTEPISPTEVTEVVDDIDSTESLNVIEIYVESSNDYLRIISGCVVFFTVVILCYFSYKFFRIFF